MNFWYISQPAEILVDMDKPRTSLPHADRRIKAAIEGGQLNVRRVETHLSTTPDHVHALITLHDPLPPAERIIWGVMFHGDIYRGCSSLMRVAHGVPCPDLLITPSEFLRPPNRVCWCAAKHSAEVMDVCPAAIVLRGDERLRSFFGAAKNVSDFLLNERIFPPNDYTVDPHAAPHVWPAHPYQSNFPGATRGSD